VPVRLDQFDATLLAGFREGVTFRNLRAARHGGPGKARAVYAVAYPFNSAPESVVLGFAEGSASPPA